MGCLLTTSLGWVFMFHRNRVQHFRQSTLASTYGWQPSERVTVKGRLAQGETRVALKLVLCSMKTSRCGLTSPQVSLPASRILENSELQPSLITCMLSAREPNSFYRPISFKTANPSWGGLYDPQLVVEETEVQ